MKKTKILLVILAILPLIAIVFYIFRQFLWSLPAEEMQMSKIPAGSFMMGCSDFDDNCNKTEKPSHLVHLSAFYMDKTPVTNGQYRQCVLKKKCEAPKLPESFNNLSEKHPVVGVSWMQARKFCEVNGKKLPTEAEWEYAARAGSTKVLYGELNKIAWWRENSNKSLQPVGLKKPNDWGLYDMIGNVWEWCNDTFRPDYYAKSPSKNPQGPKESSQKVLRGGNWNNSERHFRVSARSYDELDNYYDGVGFRCVKNIE